VNFLFKSDKHSWFVLVYWLWCVGFGVWLCECSLEWVDWSDIRLQAAMSGCSGSRQRVPSSVLWRQCWHLRHWWSAQENGHHRLYQQLWTDSKAGYCCHTAEFNKLVFSQTTKLLLAACISYAHSVCSQCHCCCREALTTCDRPEFFTITGQMDGWTPDCCIPAIC